VSFASAEEWSPRLDVTVPSCWKMMSSEYWTQISQSIEREVEVSVRDIERFLGKLSVKEFFQNSHKL